MSEEKNHIDQLFREGLDGHSVKPSETSWNAIASQIHVTKPQTKAVPFKWPMIIAIGVLIGVSGMLYVEVQDLDQQMEELQDKLAESPIEKEKGLTENEVIARISRDEENKESVRVENLPVESEKVQSVKSNIEPKTNSETNSRVEVAKSNEELALKIDGYIAKNQESEHLMDHTDDDSSSEENRAKESEVGIISNTENEPVSNAITDISALPLGSSKKMSRPYKSFENIGLEGKSNLEYMSMLFKEIPSDPYEYSPLIEKDIPITSLQNSLWTIGVYGMQNITFRRLQSTAPEADEKVKQLNKVERPGYTYGLGAELGYKLSQNWKLSLGAEYSVWEQRGNHTILVSASDGSLEISPAGNPAWNYQTDVLTSLGAGFIDLSADQNPAVTELTALSTEVYPILLQVKEEIGWLSVPLAITYQRGQGRWGLFAVVGISYDYILNLGNTWTVNESLTQVEIKSARVIKSSYISGFAELGLRYKLTEDLGLKLSPRYKSWFTPILDAGLLRSYPNSGSIILGLEMNLH